VRSPVACSRPESLIRSLLEGGLEPALSSFRPPPPELAFPEIIWRDQSLLHMLDQASVKRLLRARAELIAAMFLIGKRVRQRKIHDLTLPLPASGESIPVPARAMAASTHS
jgi:hypothetical protein